MATSGLSLAINRLETRRLGLHLQLFFNIPPIWWSRKQNKSESVKSGAGTVCSRMAWRSEEYRNEEMRLRSHVFLYYLILRKLRAIARKRRALSIGPYKILLAHCYFAGDQRKESTRAKVARAYACKGWKVNVTKAARWARQGMSESGMIRSHKDPWRHVFMEGEGKGTRVSAKGQTS